MCAQHVRDRLAHRHRGAQRGVCVLVDELDSLSETKQRFWIRTGDVFPAEEQPARCGANESDEGLRNRALAAATLSHESEDLALRDGKSHAIHGVDSCIAAAEEPLNETAEDWKVHLQVADFEERFRHWDRPSRDGMRPSDGPLPRVAAPGTRSRKRPSVCHIADRTGIPRSRREDSGARRGPNRDSSSPNR